MSYKGAMMTEKDSSVKKRVKQVLFSFDYELYLGVSSGDVHKTIISPTAILLDILKENGFHGIFFIDTIYLCRLKELCASFSKASKDYMDIVAQLNRIVNEGHQIFPHIHAHWLDAEYKPDTNTWCLMDYSKYSFASLDYEMQEGLFASSINILKEIIESDNLVLDGYRAGGWNIQPFSSFYPFFKKYGIKYEFSVIPGKSLESDSNWYDYRNCCQKHIYRFEDNVCVENRNGDFTEFSISVLEAPKWISYWSNKVNVLFFILKLKFAWPMGNGKTIQLFNSVNQDEFYTGKKRSIASFEDFDLFYTLYQLNNIRNKDYWHFISHPKILSPMNLFFARYFMKQLKKRYTVISNFRNF
jgi:hypothetical protein